MSKFTESFRNIFKIEELRTRLLFTAGLLIVVRVGSHITLPGVDAGVLASAMRSNADNTLFGLYDLFVGGAFHNAAIFALGIMPYISASIMTVGSPSSREAEMRQWLSFQMVSRLETKP